ALTRPTLGCQPTPGFPPPTRARTRRFPWCEQQVGPRQSCATDVSNRPELAGQSLVVIGGSSGIGLETARRARDEGARIIITARNPDRVHRAGLELGASIAAFDATDFARLDRFFDELPAPVDHVMVPAPGPR